MTDAAESPPAVVRPPSSDKRRVILCADDYGISPGVNRAIRDLIVRGRLNATSVMVVAPTFSRAEALSLSILNTGAARVAIGLHVTLTAPFRPLSKNFAPLRNAAFLPLARLAASAWLGRLDRARLAEEIAAQLDAFAAFFGRPPDFIDGHQHIHLFPHIASEVLAVAKRQAPNAWVRQCAGPRRRIKQIGDPKGFFLDAMSRRFRESADQMGVPTNPAFSGTYSFKARADFAGRFAQFLRGMPDGGLIMCHPGHVDDELRRLDPLTDLREREYAYLSGDDFAALLEGQGFRLH